ncbi:50S ribosomal protein L3 [Pyrodictium occultum]|uniref:Large ribosomal subunit protein uL3 n=1 Tax=Pyrodictium occultum TaxID=2309 RepID=A0A0V8RWF5_PYROC|nr:50S ribosomal protein L3 [Pyrodictium occultum]KSW12360.1 50S ribosomal protein L3 [Pyrodictium occultum]
MGARKKHAPRRGSLAVRPRKRASSIVPRVKSWPNVESENPLPLAFLGYKAGMTHVFVIDDEPGSLTHGREIFVPVTIVETPPMIVTAVRVYGYDPNIGLYTLGEAWAQPETLEEKYKLGLNRVIPRLRFPDAEKAVKKLEEKLGSVYDVRIIAATQPRLVGGLSKKKPDLIEIKIGGGKGIEDRFGYAVKLLGNPLDVRSVFREGQLVDVIAVTKGKGFQGVIKRYGVKELPRWHKHRKGSRSGPGSRGPATTFSWSEVPQPGQMGFHRRTEYNKRILRIGDNGLEVTPSGGFPHYGIVRSTYVMLAGSIPGTPKRPIVLRHPVRPSWTPESAPKITYISLQSKQGN